MITSKKECAPYAGVAQKDFKPALKQFMMQEFPSVMGPQVLDLFSNEVEKLVNKFYPPKDIIKPGQMIWYAVAKEDKPSFNKSMKETKLIPVKLNIVSDDDIKQLTQNKKLKEVQDGKFIRLFNEAYEQGGVLALADVSVITNRHISTISEIVRNYEVKHNVIVPRRGTIHDLGRSISHKRIICKKRVIERKTTEQIARECDHSPQDVEIYTNALKRITYCLKKGLTQQEISFVTSMSEHLVQEYIEIRNDFDKLCKDNDVIF